MYTLKTCNNYNQTESRNSGKSLCVIAPRGTFSSFEEFDAVGAAGKIFRVRYTNNFQNTAPSSNLDAPVRHIVELVK